MYAVGRETVPPPPSPVARPTPTEDQPAERRAPLVQLGSGGINWRLPPSEPGVTPVSQSSREIVPLSQRGPLLYYIAKLVSAGTPGVMVPRRREPCPSPSGDKKCVSAVERRS